MEKVPAKKWELPYLVAFLFIVILLLSGCAPVQQCPIVTCPNCPTSSTPANQLVFAYFIDVGQGDAALIKSGETEMLVDCGKNSQGPSVVDFLESKGVGDLEYLLITHPDSDHLGGCDDVLKAFNVHSVIVNGQVVDTVSYREVVNELDSEQLIIAGKGNAWNIGPAEVRVIQANNGFDDTNQNSIVTKLSYGPSDILFMGDCDRACEDRLLDNDVQAEVLKVAHHGSKFGTEIDFLQAVSPQVGIISVGPNSYGHPTQEVLDRLSQEGVSVYRTDLNGDIIVTLNGESYEVVS